MASHYVLHSDRGAHMRVGDRNRCLERHSWDDDAAWPDLLQRLGEVSS